MHFLCKFCVSVSPLIDAVSVAVRKKLSATCMHAGLQSAGRVVRNESSVGF